MSIFASRLLHSRLLRPGPHCDLLAFLCDFSPKQVFKISCVVESGNGPGHCVPTASENIVFFSEILLLRRLPDVRLQNQLPEDLARWIAVGPNVDAFRSFSRHLRWNCRSGRRTPAKPSLSRILSAECRLQVERHCGEGPPSRRRIRSISRTSRKFARSSNGFCFEILHWTPKNGQVPPEILYGTFS